MRCCIAVAFSALFAAACYGPPVATPATRVTQESPIFVPPASNRVDILFVIDNSLSMDAMQAELRAALRQLLVGVQSAGGERRCTPTCTSAW